MRVCCFPIRCGIFCALAIDATAFAAANLPTVYHYVPSDAVMSDTALNRALYTLGAITAALTLAALVAIWCA